MMLDSSATAQPRLTEFERAVLWAEWIGAETRCRYFSKLATKFSNAQQAITALSLFLSTGAIAAILAEPHIQEFGWWLKLALPTLTAALNAISVVRQYSKKSVDCSDLSHKWGKLALDYQALWGKMYEEDAPARLNDLQDKSLDLSKSGHSIGDWQRLLLKCQDSAESYLEGLTQI